jgi:N-acetylglucosaminyldiphosphoundecaprenol N-acetyl-beta-D-mannosaminyltransferase
MSVPLEYTDVASPCATHIAEVSTGSGASFPSSVNLDEAAREHDRNQRIGVFGVEISAVTMADATTAIEGWIDKRAPSYVCVTGVHGVIECQNDTELRDIHNRAGLVTPDGMPVVWMSRWLGATRIERVCGSDLMRGFTARAATRGYRHFYYGGGPGVADKLAAALSKANPGLKVVGTLCPPFRTLTPEEDAEIVAEINEVAPDIVWVGLSTPKQERWMASHIGVVNAPVMIGVGAAFDFLAGLKRQAPRWMQRIGLEWLFRLLTEPRRLWRRYAYIVPTFLALATWQALRMYASGLRAGFTIGSIPRRYKQSCH